MTIYKDLIGETEGTVCGADFSRVLSLVDRLGAPILVASFQSFYFTLRRKWALPGATDADEDVIAQASLVSGITTEDESSIGVALAGSVLEVPPRVYVYDVKGITLLAQRIVLVRGNFEILPRATASTT